MKPRQLISSLIFICICLLFTHCEKEEIALQDDQAQALATVDSNTGNMKKPEGAGNCLSFPVIWAEGVTKALRGISGTDPVVNGEWWYTWGTNGVDPDVTPASCPPDPDEINFDLNPEGLPFCDDGIPGSLTLPAGEPPADNPKDLARAYLQKDFNNVWQAQTLDTWPVDNIVDWIDWGDNLESVDWYTRSQVRTEVVLFEDNPNPVLEPWLEYEMRHVSGWGIDEVHGLAASIEDQPLAFLGPGDKATVYSHCARLIIQKLYVDDPEDPVLGNLEWVPTIGWKEIDGYPDDLINDVALLNKPVFEAGDGPGYYSAEINVKGRIIYGYTWNVRKSNEGAGLYRITFSLDSDCPTAMGLNTDFVDGITEILVPLEEDIIEQIAIAESDDSGDSGGGTGVLRGDLNLTYMDIRILERGGGGSGGGNPRGGGNGGGHN